MKKLIVLILFLIGVAGAQNLSLIETAVLSSKNSSTAILDSGEVFTGTRELIRGYSSFSINVKSSASGFYRVYFYGSSTATTTMRTERVEYTANDTTAIRYFLSETPYVQVVYTNGVDSQTTFELITMLYAGQVSPTINFSTDSDFDTGNEFYATSTDTLSGASDTVTFNFGKKYLYGFITVRDTTGGSVIPDSMGFYNYIEELDAYSSTAYGFKKMGTDVVTVGTCMVPGDGTIQSYMVNSPYPGRVKIIWYYGGDKAGRIVPIEFRGTN